LEKGKISRSQLIILMVGFCLGSSVVLVPGGGAKQDAWLAILAGMGEGILFALIYSFLLTRFRGKTLIQINDLVYGPYLGKLISVFFLWFLLHLGSMVLRNFSDFFTMTTMTETPSLVFLILIALVCAVAVRGGLEVIARCSQVLVPILILVLILTLLMLLQVFDLGNFQPILEGPLKKFLWAAHGAATFPFGETVAFLMVIPFLNKAKAIPSSVSIALLISGVTLSFSAFRNIGVLGNLNNIFLYPSFQAARLIKIGEVLSRMEIFVVTNFLTMGFLKIAVLIYGTALGSAQLFGLKTYRPLVIPVSIIMIILALVDFSNVIENVEFATVGYPIYALPFEVGIPLVTLLIALIRKLPREGV
jgi:spore germination protein KB